MEAPYTVEPRHQNPNHTIYTNDISNTVVISRPPRQT